GHAGRVGRRRASGAYRRSKGHESGCWTTV
ncbi:uncharacterized protein METZ01_LOCUS498309, partial [marine metagenome]